MQFDLFATPRLRAHWVLLALLGPLAHGAHANTGTDNFSNLSLEELGAVSITSASKRSERLGDAAASVFVIRADNIRRSGAATLPEALRLAPNLQVARADARNYAITARGFNSVLENKLLVLIDGRTVYSPLFSGVFWDAQDVVLEDIERIEVISGPGATLWGANAVNGVINIITRSAAATQGALVSADLSRDLRSASARFGGKLGESAHYRIYAKRVQADDSERADGAPSLTGWQRRQAGFRIDADAGGAAMTLQGDAYQGNLHQAGTPDIAIDGANLLARLERTLAGGSELRLQAYVDHTTRDQPNAFVEHINTLDLEVQHTLNLSANQQLIWGGGHRIAYDRVANDNKFAFLPGARDLAWTNVFAQDQISLTPALRLTAGLKAERNSYTGLEYLPSLSLAWQGVPDHLVWASLARAVRVPSRTDRDFFSPTNPPLVGGVPRYGVAGGPDFESEVARVAQLGLRARPLPALSYSLKLYYSQYERLRTLEPNSAGTSLVFLNRAFGATRGAEFSTRWDVNSDLRITGGVTVQHLALRTEPGSGDVSGAIGVGNNDPRHWALLRVSHDLSDALELDLTLRHVGRLPKPAVPAYEALDLRLGWSIRPGLELSLLAQNLLGSRHAEFGAEPARSVFGRSALARLSWRF